VARCLGVDPALVREHRTVDAGLPSGSARLYTTLDSSRLREEYGIAAPDTATVVDSVIEASGWARR